MRDGVVLLLPVLLVFASCRHGADIPATTPRKVAAVTVSAVHLLDQISGFGSISFLRKIDVSAPQDAIIGRLSYREGDFIKAGSVVTRLQNPQMQLALERSLHEVSQAEATLALAAARLFEGKLAAETRILALEKIVLELARARKELDESSRKQADQETLFLAGGLPWETIRTGRFSLENSREAVTVMEKEMEIALVGLRDQDLIAAGIEPPSEAQLRKEAFVELSVASLSAELNAAMAVLEIARKEAESAGMALSELTLLAPASGVIGAKYLEEGERIKRDEKLCTIIDVGSLYAIAPIREAEASRIAAGMEALIVVDSLAATYKGVVDAVAPVSETGSGSFNVKVLLSDPERRLKPGMFARMTINSGNDRVVLVVPDSALVGKEGNSASLFVIAEGRLSLRVLELGLAVEEGRVVLSGLLEGEVVVNKPAPGLKEGERVEISG